MEPSVFCDVDRSERALEATRYLDGVSAVLADVRQQWLSELRLPPSARFLDAGCGTGGPTASLSLEIAAAGLSVNVDLSHALTAQAKLSMAGVSNVVFNVADVTSLPFGDETFDAIYCERVFQHLQHPRTALNEFLRVLRPGGCAVVVDVDHTGTAVDADDADLADLLTGLARQLVVNPRAGRHLRSQFVTAGFSDVAARGNLRLITDAEEFSQLAAKMPEPRQAALIDKMAIPPDRMDSHRTDLRERQAGGRFQVSLSLYCVSGTKGSAS